MDGIKSLVESANSILRTAQSETFIRLIRLALLYHSPDLSRAVQSRWLTRMHWHELPSAPALVIADAYDLRHLLCHAYYVHLVNVAHLIVRTQPIDMYLSLSASQNLHVLCGYHSLRAVWRHLQTDPLEFRRAEGCSSQGHKRCLVAWATRWAVEIERPSALPSVDVLRRLFLMEQHLEADVLLRECMRPGCWRVALDAIARKRAEISDNLHHHFDL
ncbi:hypothetical protein FB45DRAFT_895666 [Roridomyces roridus]|uniref:Uncharacterized protein n=1 Tax=Roridomyces roridus TaxID=1738132 RepID=A0AAD7CAK2_9AGAR|nr:hypothetical protein FB45DRAFT_895666 [Roridomyces roridus]